MSPKRIQLLELRKCFGDVPAIEDISLDIEAGEFLVLLGPSGCGKSTLLNVVAGLEAPSRGKVMIGDRDVTTLEPGQRDVAMVFQSYALYPTMTVRRNIAFALTVNGTPKREIQRRVEEVARLLQIQDLLDRKPAQLSGGQQQRVAIGRALVRDPAAFLLDEPLSNVDTKLRTEMRVELKRLHDKFPRTTLYVTHDQMEAMALATRVVVINKGRIQQCDRPSVIYSRPANQFVASFVGAPAMKLIAGRLCFAEDMAVLSTEAGEVLPLPKLAGPCGLESGRPVSLGVRPEDVHLVAAGSKGSVEGRVLMTEPSGPDTYVLIALAGGEVTTRVASRSSPHRQEQVSVLIDGSAVSLFCPDTGKRLN